MPVRYVSPDGWEAYCGACKSWWPLDLEFWSETIRGGTCAACYKLKNAERERIKYAADEAKRARQRANQRRYRASMTPAELQAVREKRRGYYWSHLEEQRQRCRESRARRRAA